MSRKYHYVSAIRPQKNFPVKTLAKELEKKLTGLPWGHGHVFETTRWTIR